MRPSSSSTARHDGVAGPVEPAGKAGEGVGPGGDGRVVGQEAGPVEVAGRGPRRRQRGVVGVAPSCSSVSAMSGSGSGVEVDPDAAGGDGHQLDRDVVGQDHEHRRRRRLLDRLQQARPRLPVGAGGTRRGSSTFRRPSTGDSEATPDDLLDLLLGDGRRRPARPRGRRGARRPAASRAVAAGAGRRRRVQEQGGEGPGGLELACCRRSDEEVGVDGIGGRGRAAGRPPVGWPTTRVPMTRIAPRWPLGRRSLRVTGRSARTAARTASATSSIDPAAVDHDPALRIGGGQPAEARRATRAWKLGPGALEPVELAPPHAVGQLLGRRRRGGRPGRASTRRWPTR